MLYTLALLGGKNKLPVQNSHLRTIHKKSKAIPLQAWRGPEGSRRLRLPDVQTIGT